MTCHQGVFSLKLVQQAALASPSSPGSGGYVTGMLIHNKCWHNSTLRNDKMAYIFLFTCLECARMHDPSTLPALPKEKKERRTFVGNSAIDVVFFSSMHCDLEKADKIVHSMHDTLPTESYMPVSQSVVQLIPLSKNPSLV